MKNKKLMFSEERFVFFEPFGHVPAEVEVPVDLTGETPAQKVARLKRKRANALKASGERLEKAKMFFKLSSLDFGGKTFEITFGKASLKAMLTTMKANVLGVLDSKKNKAMLEGVIKMFKIGNVDMKLADLKLIAAGVYGKGLLDSAKKHLNDKYKHLSAYVKAKNLKDLELKAKLSTDAAGKLKVEFTSDDPQLFTKYKEWVKTYKPQSTPGQKPDTGKEKVSSAALARFAESPLGKLFKHWKEGDKNMLELMQAGKAPLLALFIAGMFGYTGVSQGTFAGAVDMTGEHKGKFMKYAKRARASRLGAIAYNKKHPKKTPAANAAEPVNAKYFADAIEQNSIPKKGLKLSEDYVLKKGESLVVDLTGGGQVVLPKGGKTRAYVDSELADPGKVYKNVKITFSNTIPKGTVITGKVDLKRVAPKKAA